MDPLNLEAGDTRFRNVTLTGEQMNFIRYCLVNVIHPVKIDQMQRVFGWTDAVMLALKRADEELHKKQSMAESQNNG